MISLQVKSYGASDLHEYAARPMIAKDGSVFVVTITDKMFKLDEATGVALVL